MDNIIASLKRQINYAKANSEELNDVSWGMQEGVLISVNEAEIIFKKLVELGCCTHSDVEYIPGVFAVNRCKICGERM